MNLCGYYHTCHRLSVKMRIHILVTLWQLLIPLPIYLLFLIYFILHVFLYYAWAVLHNIANLMVFPPSLDVLDTRMLSYLVARGKSGRFKILYTKHLYGFA